MIVFRTDLSKTRSGLIAIIAGTAGGQVLALLASPILTRLYSPADFGVFSVVSSLAILFSSVSTLRLELAIPLANTEAEAHALVMLGLAATLVSTSIGTVGLWMQSDMIGDALGDKSLSSWVWIAPCIAIPTAAYQLANALAVRGGRYGAIARRNFLQSVSTVIFQLTLGFARFRPGGLVAGLAAGQIVGLLPLFRGSDMRGNAAREGRMRRTLIAAASRFKKFPLFLAPAGLINTLGLQLPVLLFAYLYGSTEAGWFGLTQRVLGLPLILVGQAVAQVYIGELAKAKRSRDGSAPTLFWAASRRLLVAGVGVGALLGAVGPFAFDLVFGEQWKQSGQMARALAMTLAAQMVATPLSQTLVIFERNAIQFCWDVARLLSILVSITACAFANVPVLTTVWVYSSVATCTYVLSWGLSSWTITRLREAQARG